LIFFWRSNRKKIGENKIGTLVAFVHDERESKKIAGVQVEHVKALFAKCVKGCGFYVHVSECAPRFVAKKNWRRRREI